MRQNTDMKVDLFLDENKIEKSQDVALFGTTIDDKLSFIKHIFKNICRKAKDKLHTLERLRKHLSTDKAKAHRNAFISSHFYYVPIIWMFPGKL